MNTGQNGDISKMVTILIKMVTHQNSETKMVTNRNGECYVNKRNKLLFYYCIHRLHFTF